MATVVPTEYVQEKVAEALSNFQKSYESLKGLCDTIIEHQELHRLVEKHLVKNSERIQNLEERIKRLE